MSLRAAVAAGGLSLLFASSVAAQPPSFLPRADFAFTWGSLLTSDRRFDWLGQLAIDFDIVDYGHGRLRFQTEVEGSLGRERRRYDLNQGTFGFDASLSYRLSSAAEVEAVVQHVSRHVVDRENPPAVSWNAAGVRIRGRSPVGLEGRAELVYATQPAFVDYSWIARAEAGYRHRMSPRLSVFGAALGEVIGTDATLRGKNRVCGGRVEAGLRVAGEAAALELFVGYERRVDAFPTDRYRVRWITAGFRVLSGQ